LANKRSVQAQKANAKKVENKSRKIKEKRKKSGQAKATKTFYVPLCEHLPQLV